MRFGWVTEVALVAPAWAGTITDVFVTPGDTITEGAPIAQVDGVARVAAATDIPMYRSLGLNDRGADVEQVQQFLRRIEVLDAAAALQSGVYDRPTREAVSRLAALLGVPAAAANVLGKRVIRSQDRAGFIVNALFVPFIIAAIRMYESGFASAEDIDNGMVEGCNHPVGPLRLADAIGLDTIKAVGDSLYAEFKESLYAPPPLLARMVEAGHLGRKTKRGFYTY
jgi:hypothetical protein